MKLFSAANYSQLTNRMDSGEPFFQENDLKFPVITVSISYDDINEPIRVDLGSVPPFIACAVLEKVISVLRAVSPGPTVAFRGGLITDARRPNDITWEQFFQAFIDDDGDEDES